MPEIDVAELTYKLPPIPTPPDITKAPTVVPVEAVVLSKINVPVLGIFIPGGAVKGLLVAILYSHRSTRKSIGCYCICR